MRRVNGLATLHRAISVSGGATATQHRLVQVEMMSTSSTNSPKISDRVAISGPSVARGVAGTMFFSVVAASLSQEVHAKEPLKSVNLAPKEVVLYQYEACPFCNKVKAFLDYNKIPYQVVEVNPISKKEIKWSDYKKVPILTVDGEQMVDSSDIIDKLFNKLHPGNETTDSDEERKWRGWVDNHLVHVLSPNIYRTSAEALESFDYITSHGNFSFTERLVAKYAGAAAMYFVSKKLKKKYNITDERKALYDAAETWVDALNGRQYLGGSKPNLADLAVFGVLRPIRYLKSGRDMVEHTRIGEWYTRMEGAVGESSRIKV
ncbi:GST_C domain-containing protein/GST_N_3 domain-containing protein [Cephalotus follicularis]|uniref:Prostaglandin E synthase 2 n=1 Tax=Cephalotus follicularis TaxID=3775 RepID=A0A1Q3ALZ8_CEPFO|nr:GST_C domain-containing protein/GST_N_3 domain-containing protein [Cephalotus follicularis]